MSKTTKEIECLNRLQVLTQQLDSILSFLKQENIIDEISIKNIRHSSDRAKDIQYLLRDLQIKRKLQLLEFEWSILPMEIIRIYIVTDMNQMEFTYGI